MAVDVRAEQDDAPAVDVRDEAAQHNRQRVRLFAGGTACAPQRQIEVILLAALCDQRRQDLVFQQFKLRIIAEEIRLANRQRFDDRLPQIRVDWLGAQQTQQFTRVMLRVFGGQRLQAGDEVLSAVGIAPWINLKAGALLYQIQCLDQGIVCNHGVRLTGEETRSTFSF